VVSARFITVMADPGGNRILMSGSAGSSLAEIVGSNLVLMNVLCCQV